jgi:DNA gyrase/topoisomerase IV subunit B
MPNAFRTSRSNFFANEEVQGIIKIVFGEEWKPGKKFTIEDCKVSKVIFMADADVDRITVRKCFSQNHAGNY